MGKAFYAIFFVCLLLLGCAKPVAPTGGPKDEVAPLYVKFSEDSPATLFNEEKIVIAFNEFITLQNASDVRISPRMAEEPKIKVKGKKVIVELPEQLDSNYTYKLGFGGAIKDFTEGNEIEALDYVFSLSENIDSASVMGSYVDAKGNAIEENCVISLYPLNESYRDSLIYTEPALFYTINTEQAFSVNYLAKGAYQLVVLQDKNKNEYFDLGEELLGFVADTIVVSDNDTIKLEQINLFNPFEEELRVEQLEIVSRETMKIKLNKGSKSLELKPIIEDDLEYFSCDYPLDNDSLLVYFKSELDSFSLLLYNEGLLVDTVDVVQDTTLFEQNILAEFEESEKQTGEEAGFLTLPFNMPVKQIDFNEWILKQKVDSVYETRQIDTVFYMADDVFVKAEWVKGEKYELTILPETIIGFNNTAVFDSLDLSIVGVEAIGFGDAIINIAIDSMLVDQSFIEIVSESGADVYYDKQAVETDSLVLNKLKVGNYKVKLVVDANGNNKWDTGDFFNRKQAEQIFSYDKLEIKANWETEITIK